MYARQIEFFLQIIVLVDGDALVMLLGEKGEQPFGIEWRLPRFEQMEIGQTLIEK